MQREPQEADFWSHFLTLSHPRSPSIGASPVPFLTGLFGIDVVDAGIRVDLHQSLTANLPWFQLLAVIEEQPGKFTKMSAPVFMSTNPMDRLS